MAEWFPRKASLNFQMQMTLDQGQEMTLTLHTHFINSISRLHLPTFRSPAAIVSEKSTAFTFFL